MHRTGAFILGMLYYEHHYKSDDGSTGIYYQLPGIRKMKKRARASPDDNGQTSHQNGAGTSTCFADGAGNFFKL